MNFEDYEFRCSALGNIISKSGKLTDSNKTYLNELFIGAVYGIQKEVSSKYFEKGIYQEEDGITLLQRTLHPGTLVLKNKERVRNGWIHGECDAKVGGIVYDIKNAWDRFTFGKASLTHNYEWQLRGYMWLLGLEHGRLYYCLNNTPEHILLDEERRLFYQGRFLTTEDSAYLKACEELRAAHNYDRYPLYERFRVWDIHHDEAMIDQAKKAITDARRYLASLWEDRQDFIATNRRLMGLPDEPVLIASAIPEGILIEPAYPQGDPAR